MLSSLCRPVESDSEKHRCLYYHYLYNDSVSMESFFFFGNSITYDFCYTSSVCRARLHPVTCYSFRVLVIAGTIAPVEIRS